MGGDPTTAQGPGQGEYDDHDVEDLPRRPAGQQEPSSRVTEPLVAPGVPAAEEAPAPPAPPGAQEAAIREEAEFPAEGERTAPAGRAESPDPVEDRPGEPAESQEAAAAERLAAARSMAVRQRRRRRAVSILASIVVLVLVAGAGLAFAENYARDKVRDHLIAGLPGLSEDARVTTRGIVLLQAYRNQLETVTVTASSLTLGGDAFAAHAEPGQIYSVELDDFSATLTGLEVRSPHVADEVEAAGTVSWQELAELIAQAMPEAPGVVVSPGRSPIAGDPDDPGTLDVKAQDLGTELAFEVEPRVDAGGGLVLTIISASIGPVAVDMSGPQADVFLGYLGLDSNTIEIGSDTLPSGMAYSRARINDAGLRIELSGMNVTLG